MKKENRILSSDGMTRLYVACWEPENKVRAVVHLVHDMADHIERYEEFAECLNSLEIAVVGMDCLGHGNTAQSAAEYGYFGPDGRQSLMKDMLQITRYARTLYPGVPVVLMGCGTSCILCRKFVTLFGKETDGLILSGPGYLDKNKALWARAAAKEEFERGGAFYRSRLCRAMTAGSYEQYFSTVLTEGSWLTRDEPEAAKYDEDPACGFYLTASAWYDLARFSVDLSRKKDFDKIPRELPVLILSGMDDAAGGFTKDVLKLYNESVWMGMKDMDIQFYRDTRHDLLHEINRMKVFRDILDWLEQHVLRTEAGQEAAAPEEKEG